MMYLGLIHVCAFFASSFFFSSSDHQYLWRLQTMVNKLKLDRLINTNVLTTTGTHTVPVIH